MTKLTIATLNLNGETLRRSSLRVPKFLLDFEKIKNQMTENICKGLREIIAGNTIDILAIQELVYTKKYYNILLSCISDEYKIIVPTNITPHVHFINAFIVKKELSIKEISSVEIDDFPLNRQLGIEYTYCENECKKTIKIVNLHIKLDVSHFKIVENYISKQPQPAHIILGDMNAYTSKQIDQKAKSSSSNDKFFQKFTDNDYITAANNDMNYTFIINNRWRKLDHIYISNKITSTPKSIGESVNKNVNFYLNEREGFTDHSMLIQTIEF